MYVDDLVAQKERCKVKGRLDEAAVANQEAVPVGPVSTLFYLTDRDVKTDTLPMLP